jgi:hypothetical protein
VEGSASEPAVTEEANLDVDDDFFNSHENFDEPRSWWHGHDSSCEGETDSNNEDENDYNEEGGGLDDILTWPPELLFPCKQHPRPKRKTKAGNFKRGKCESRLNNAGAFSFDDVHERGGPSAE